MLHIPSHLLLRSGIYNFRIVVAERLRPAFCGRTEFHFPLFTRDKRYRKSGFCRYKQIESG